MLYKSKRTGNKIYLGNLNTVVTDELLKEHFAQYGEITEIHLPRDKKSREPKGYAFITFADVSSAEKSLEQNDKPFLGKEITVQIAVEKQTRKPAQP